MPMCMCVNTYGVCTHIPSLNSILTAQKKKTYDLDLF